MWKILAGLLVLLILFSGCSSIGNPGVGPSPSFGISISNASDYPEYDFYYVGNMWDDKLTLIKGDVEVYKLNTHINVYAVPKEINVNGKFEETISKSVKSQDISLDSGENEFEVSSFDTEKRTMFLSQ